MNVTLDFIELIGFATYEKMVFDFSPGLTMVLGNNGSGKSTIIEGVCYALYGRTMRGELPKPGAVVNLVFTIDSLPALITRERPKKGGGSNLSFTYNGEDLTAQTPTETQLKIEGLIGSWEAFAASRLFSREFMAKFAASTDKERKQLLEGILGLEKFDRALVQSRDRLALQENTLRYADAKLTAQAEALDLQNASIASMGEVENPADLEAEILAASAALDEANETSVGFREERDKLHVEWAEVINKNVVNENSVKGFKDQIRELDAKRVRAQRIADCPVCLRAVNNDAHTIIEKHYRDQIDPLHKKIAEIEEAMKAVTVESEKLAKEMQAVAKKVSAAEDEERECSKERERLVGRRDVVDKRAREYAASIDAAAKISADIKALEAKKVTAESEVAVSRALVEVFGLRGARVLLLGQALGALEGKANAALRSLGLPMTIELKTSTTLKSGKEVDALHVGVTGAGDGVYNACSAGEKARVDVALMLGLSALLGGAQAGFLAFDEVFDTLDPEGIERVAEYIGEMSEKRQAIVISHHSDLRSLFPRGQIVQAVKDSNGVSRLESL